MITITGAAGFIGSALAARLNAEGFNDLVLVDDFAARPDKARNHEGRTCVKRVDRADFPRGWKPTRTRSNSCSTSVPAPIPPSKTGHFSTGST